VPGNLYFGLSAAVVRALRQVATAPSVKVEPGEPATIGGGGGGGGGGGVLATPIAVGRGCAVLELGVVQDRPGWEWRTEQEGAFQLPRGFRSRRTFPSMTREGASCEYLCEILEDPGGRPLFRITPQEGVEAGAGGEPVVGASPDLCWQQVLLRVDQLRAAKRSRHA
jgi:hypothetical protein